MLTTTLLGLLLLDGCGRQTEEPTVPPATTISTTTLLARHPDKIEVVELGGRVRSGRPLQRRIRLTAKPTKQPGLWSVDLQVRAPGHHVPVGKRVPGTQVLHGKRRLTWRRRADAPWTWTVTPKGDLSIRLPEGTSPKGLVFEPGRLKQDERALDRSTFQGSDLSFVVRDQPVFQDWRHGLYLPPPTVVRIEVDVPEGAARFSSRVRNLAPVWGRSRSDGAQVELGVVEADGVRPVAALDLARDQSILQGDLSPWAGRTITLELRTKPLGSAIHDHVFLEEPAVYVPTATPRRVLLVFVDTLRADHLGLYGYPRPTSPNLDRRAAHARVFDNAHGTAPWTLPSSRGLLTGRQPEDIASATTLQEFLSRDGFTTVNVFANQYLGQGFGLENAWSVIRRAPQSSSRGVQQAKLLLEQYADRDLFMLLHLMDPHLPYGERKEHRIWSDTPPDHLAAKEAVSEGGLERTWAAASPVQREQLRSWATDRYDQNIRQVDADLDGVFEAFGPQTLVVFVSDHGERLFGEDGSYGHGQALEDDLTRVPMLWWGPGIEAGREPQHVSLMDVLPTLLDRVTDTPLPPELHGRSLDPILEGGTLPSVPVGFGRLLYGDQGWAAVQDEGRYQVRGPAEQLTGADDLPLWRDKVQQATGRQLVPVWRFSVPSRTSRLADRSVSWHLEIPGQIGRVWGSEDSLGGIVVPQAQGGQLEVRVPGAGHVPREIYLDRELDLVGAHLTYTTGGQTFEATISELPTEHPLIVGPPDAPLRVDAGWEALATDLVEQSIDDTTEEELRALGYIE